MATNSEIGSANQASAMTHFIAFAVDIYGRPEARYDLAATDGEAAVKEARRYLDVHRMIEVWSEDHRRVARIIRKRD